MVRLSIIVPAVGSQTDIEETLVSILENRPADCEVILAHPMSYVDPYDLADEVNFISSDDADPLSLFNAALISARGQIVHMVCPGILASEGWCDAVLEQFEINRNIGAVSPLVTTNRGRRPICGVDYHLRRGKCFIRSTKRPILSPLVETGFYRASAMRFMHGFDVRFGTYADVELGFRLRAAGYEQLPCLDSQVHSKTTVRDRPMPGYRGGKLRASLFRLAHELGITRRLPGWWGLLGEPMNHGFGPTTIAAMLGHLAIWMRRSAKPTRHTHHSSIAVDAESPHQHRRAA